MDKNFRENYALTYRDYIYNQNNFAETKNGVLLTLVGVLFGLILNNIGDIENKTVIYYLYFVIVCLFISFIISLLSFIPRFISSVKKTKNENLYYFGYIKKLDVDKLKAELDENDLEADLLAQNITMSAIVDRKFKLFNYAVKIFLGAIIPPYFIYWGVRVLIKVIRKRVQNKNE